MPPSHPTEATTAAERAPWAAPAIVCLPRLSELTLATGGGIPGGGDTGSGSTVVP
jgi:hypothetical protein